MLAASPSRIIASTTVGRAPNAITPLLWRPPKAASIIVVGEAAHMAIPTHTRSGTCLTKAFFFEVWKNRRLGGQGLNREIVSCRAVCADVRARSVLGQVSFQPKRPICTFCTFPFPLGRAGLSLFPCETIYSHFLCDQSFLMISRILAISLVSIL